MPETVSELTLKAFSDRSAEQKLRIIRGGKPRPEIGTLIFYNGKWMPVNELYDQEMWLTACEHRDAIFCWTCLLFLPANKSGMCDNMNKCSSFISLITDEELKDLIDEHKKYPAHIHGLFQFRMFLKEKCPKAPIKSQIELDKNHREILKRLIDVVCFLVNQASPPANANNNYDAVKIEDCVQTLKLLKYYDATNIVDDTINFITEHPKVLTDILEAMTDAVIKSIKKEIRACSYVTLILSKHSESQVIPSKVSAVLRYVYQGNVCERFIEFTNSDFLKGVSILKDYIMKLISEYEITKLLALSFDGDIPVSYFSVLIASIRKQNSFSFFVPCYFHDFNCVLEQKLLQFHCFQLFFKSINSMNNFFQDNSEICDFFHSFTDGKVHHLKNFKLSNSQFLRLLKMHRREFVSFFSHIVQNPQKWNNDVVAKALGFVNILDEYQMIFLLEAFYRLFEHVAILSEMLNSCSPENVFDANIIYNVTSVLLKEKIRGFENIWTYVITEIIENCSRETLEGVGKEQTDELQALFLKGIDCIVEEIQARFDYVYKLDFLSLFNCESHDKLIVSDYQKDQLDKIPESLVVKEHLIKELEVLRKNGGLFGGKSVHESMSILREADLQDIFVNAYKLAEIILTMPCKPASHTNASSSKIDLINDWASVPDNPKMKFLSILCIEKDHLEYLKTRLEFYDEVICKLQNLNSGLVTMFSEFF